MSDKKKKYLVLYLLIGAIGSLYTLFYGLSNYYFYDNSLQEKKMNLLQEKIKEEEEIINEEKNNNFSFLDNTIINIIIFLLIFLITVYLVYFSPLSPVVKNNQKETIEGNKTNTDFGRSILRKTGDFDGERFFEKEYALYFYDSNKYGIEGNENDEEILVWLPMNDNLQLSLTIKNDIFNFSQYRGDLIVFEDRKRIPDLTLKQIIEIKKKSAHELNKRLVFSAIEENHREIVKHRELDSFSQEMKDIYFIEKFIPNYQVFFERLKGKTDFFNFHNVIAALLSYGIFFSSFYVLYLIFYFFYVLIYLFFFLNEEEIKEEEKENKFLIAFYRTLRAVVFLNFHGFSKIIPILCFFGVFIFGGVLFFGKNIFFFPIFYNDKEKKFLRIYSDVDLKNFLKGGKVVIPINNICKSSFFLPPEEKPIKEKKIIDWRQKKRKTN